MVNRAARARREDLAVKGPVVAAVAVVAEVLAVAAVAVVAEAAVAVAVAVAGSGWLPITRIAFIETGMKTPNL